MTMTAAVEAEERAYARVTWRLLPFLGACYLVAYLDRVNVGFAKLHMLADLGLSETAYGFGAGVFFVGYFLFEVPSNLALHRVGARIWIARIMVSWGIVSGAMAFTGSFAQPHRPRRPIRCSTLCASCSASRRPASSRACCCTSTTGIRRIGRAAPWRGCSPHSRCRSCSARRSRARSCRASAAPHGLYDWQWLFLLEAAPAHRARHRACCSISTTASTTRRWLARRRQASARRTASRSRRRPSTTIRCACCSSIPALWLFIAIYLLIVMGVYGINFWLPSIIQQTGVRSVLSIGWITALSYW